MSSETEYLETGKLQRDSLARKTCDLLCIYGSLCLLVYGLKARYSGMVNYSTTLFIFLALTVGLFALYKYTGNWSRHRALVTSSLSFLYLYLLASGGENNTGLFWCYVYPLVIFSIIGPQQGKWLVSAMLLVSAVILYFPEWSWSTHHYSTDIKHRFIGSIGFLSFVAFYMERARLMAQQENDIARANLAQLARSDELTGTFNRRGIEAKVREELHRVVRDRSEMSLVLCDVDFFKRINDQYGHDIGDQALQHISRILGDTVRVTDMVGRWGGEEFLIMLPNTSLNEGYQLIERVRQKIASNPLVLDGLELQMTISCGICSTRFFSDFGDLIKAADVSLYEAKAQGRNCTRPAVVA